jgi:tetratricopeptide (TPR) repeat protein
MKKLFSLLSFSCLAAIFFSCASVQPISHRPGLVPDEDGGKLTLIQKPPTDASSSGGDARQPLLPVPAPSRQETLKSLRTLAAHILSAVKVRLRADYPVKTDMRKSAATENADQTVKIKTKTALKDESARTKAVKTQPRAVAPPVVNSASTDTGAANRNSNERPRTIYARQGDDIEISFPENGWLLLEMPPAGSGLAFLSRHLEKGKTLFKFRGQKIGDYTLPFQFQDQAHGSIKRDTIEIKVVSQKEFDAVMGSRESDSDKENKAQRRAYAAKLLDLGNFKEALSEFLASYSEGDPALNHLIAALALREKDYKNAILYWRKNLDEKGETRDQAVIGLIRAYLALNDRSALLGLARALLAIQNQPIEEDLGLLIRYFSSLKDEELEFDLLQEYVKRFPEGARLAEIYFLLGQIYEFSRTILDFQKARACYQIVVKEFPESPYFAPAQERVDFINRHYFRVQ